jgi:hypothetical protein
MVGPLHRPILPNQPGVRPFGQSNDGFVSLDNLEAFGD